ncbi:hypothetical protein DRW03_32110 [Corallococcus sp. H22C18031201]|nr:hypothetical protein DRW03_32110 [Corallococcus sp. H22C18031201]
MDALWSAFQLAKAPSNTESDAITSTVLSSGWNLVSFNSMSTYFMGFDEDIPRELSKQGEVLQCVADETCMGSSARGYRGGAMLWRVEHNASESRFNIEATGTLPPCYLEIRQRLLAKQRAQGRGVDYVFSLPIEICETLTGYRYDRVYEGAIECLIEAEAE